MPAFVQTSPRQRIVAGSLFVLLPIFVSLCSIYGLFHSSIWYYLPRDCDETLFWIDANSFFHVGFRGGYSGYEEMTGLASKLGIGTYGGHGVFPFLLAALVGQVIGFTPYVTINFTNGLYLVTASLCFVVFWRGRSDMLLLAALFLGTLFPFLSHYILSWQETLHFAVVISLASVFGALVLGELSPRKRLAVFAAGCAILMMASLLRYSWSLLFIPLFILGRPFNGTGYLRSFVAGLAMVVVGYFAYKALSSPYPYGKYGFNYFEGIARGEFSLAGYLKYLAWNIGYFLTIEWDNVPDKLLLWTMSLFVFIAPTVTWIFRKDVARNLAPGIRPLDLVLFHVVNIGGVFVLSVLWYYPNSRLFAPCFALSVLLMIQYLPSKAYYILVIINLLLFPVMLEKHRDGQAATYPVQHEYKYMQQTYADFGQEMSKHVVYRPDAGPWCNTVMLLTWPHKKFLNIPPGIAIHHYRDTDKRVYPYKSAYIFIDDSSRAPEIARTTRIEALWDGPLGTLYLNRDADCPAPTGSQP